MQITREEQEVIKLLATAWGLFERLPKQYEPGHVDHIEDFRVAVHVCMDIVLARVRMRKLTDEMQR